MHRVTTPTAEEVLAFCADAPIERVFLEEMARRRSGRFRAVGEAGRLSALCHLGANVVPSGDGCAAFADVVVRTGPRMVIGDDGAVGELWDAAAVGLPAPREDRPGQPVLTLDEPPPPGDTGLRAATPEDVDLLVPACAAAHEEEIGVDPLALDAEGFRWRTRAQIDEGRSWLWADGGTILFKAEASAWTPSTVQLQQVWVDPDARGHGYAQRGMRDLCRLLLDRVPSVCLFVRPENAPARRVYEAIGMRQVGSYRSLLF